MAAYDDGLLIRLRVRQGRLGAWRCDPVGATTAARYVAGSPEVWREFAEAAARLAVRLREPGAGSVGTKGASSTSALCLR